MLLTGPFCPVCGETLRPIYGPHQGPWYCPLADAEATRDIHGDLTMRPGARHLAVRIWSADELGMGVAS